MDSTKRYYVYVWKKPDGTPFYVGKGTGDRWKRHGKSCRNQYFIRVYNKYPGCYPEIVMKDLDEETAFQEEISLIDQLKHNGFVQANLSDGGEGTSKQKPVPEEFREKMRQLVLGEKNPNYHNYWSEEQKKHLSDVKKASGVAKLGNNPRAKRVMCVETGKIYECQELASRDLGLKSMASINHALKKPTYVAKGFHFVQGDAIDNLNSAEKRAEYLESIKS